MLLAAGSVDSVTIRLMMVYPADRLKSSRKCNHGMRRQRKVSTGLPGEDVRPLWGSRAATRGRIPIVRIDAVASSGSFTHRRAADARRSDSCAAAAPGANRYC